MREGAAGLVRAMALRAELADRAGDVARARRWARAVHELWQDAETDELRGTVERMRVLSAKRIR